MNPLEAYARFVHGPRSAGALRGTLRDFRPWAAANRAGWIAICWVAALAVIGVIGNESLTSTAARAVYLLLAVYAVQLVAHETSQPSLGHAAFAALGAYATAGLRLRMGLDGMLAALAAMILGGAVGWALGWGATRLRPAILALLTWAFGWLVYVSLGAFPEVTGGVAGISIHAPLRVRWNILGVDLAVSDFGHLVLGSALLAGFLLLYRSAQGSAVGRAWAALRDSRTLATSLGYDVPAIRRWTFAVSAAVAALAGSLTAQLLEVVDPSLYSPLQSLNLFVAVLIGAPLGFFGPVVGAAVASGAPVVVDYLGQLMGLPLGPGRQLVAAALTIAALWFSVGVAERRGSRGKAGEGSLGPTEPRAATSRPSGAAAMTAGVGALLVARGLTIDFAGLRALEAVDIALPPGAIQGLVGPNGSGKSTLLRCLSGTLVPGTGTVSLDGRPLDGVDEAGRVRAGIARTFQRTAVMPHLRAGEHVQVGLRARQHHASALQAILKSPAYRAEAATGRGEALEVLTVFGLGAAADSYPETLSSGRQRLLQLATAVATGPRALLLDEPSAGMSPAEIALLHRALAALAAGGMAILLIEHNLRFLADIASQVTVLDGGRVLAAGTPAEIARDPEVQRAYLGVSA